MADCGTMFPALANHAIRPHESEFFFGIITSSVMILFVKSIPERNK